MPTANQQFTAAILEDARLIKESLVVKDETLEKAQKKASDDGIRVNAQTNATNNIRTGKRNVGGQEYSVLIVDCAIDVRVNIVDTTEAIVEYSSGFRAFFRLLPNLSVAGNVAMPPSIVASSVAQITWVATRRADSAIAATGVAQLRLNVPAVSPEVVQQALALDMTESARPIKKIGTRRSRAGRKPAP